MNADNLCGGCLCGAVRYRIGGAPRLVSHCHCSMCRRASGAPFFTWLTLRSELVAFEGAEPARRQSSAHGWRAFCAACGAQIASGSSAYPAYVEISAASLDEPGRVRPERHVFWPDRLPWVDCDDGLPRHIGDARSPLADSTRGHA